LQGDRESFFKEKMKTVLTKGEKGSIMYVPNKKIWKGEYFYEKDFMCSFSSSCMLGHGGLRTQQHGKS
jgi:hypothetical protein